jgi:hypothetical protein
MRNSRALVPQLTKGRVPERGLMKVGGLELVESLNCKERGQAETVLIAV